MTEPGWHINLTACFAPFLVATFQLIRLINTNFIQRGGTNQYNQQTLILPVSEDLRCESQGFPQSTEGAVDDFADLALTDDDPHSWPHRTEDFKKKKIGHLHGNLIQRGNWRFAGEIIVDA